MYKPNKERLSNFWIQVQNLWIKIYGSKKIFIAAINVNFHISKSKKIKI